MTYTNNMKHIRHSICHEDVIAELSTPLDSKFILKPSQKKHFNYLEVTINNKIHCINHKVDPEAEALFYVEKLKSNLTSNGTLVIIGNGLGYFTNAIQKYIDLDIKIIIIEPSIEIFKYCLHSTEMTEVFKDSRFEFLINGNVEEIEIELRHILRQPDSNINLNLLDVYHYSDIFLQFYNNLTFMLDNLINSEIDIYRRAMLKSKENHRINLIHNHITCCNENLKNLKYLFETNSLNNFKNIFKSKPAIILSAGPSLEKNIHLIKQLEGKITILAPYTSLKILDKNNIKPDMVFAMEPRQHLYKKLDNISSDIILVYTGNLKTEILKHSNFNKKILTLSTINTYYSDTFSYLNKNFESSTIFAKSVVEIIIDFALLLGCNPITFVGQDFAFTDKKTHADATYYDGKNKLNKYFYTNQKNILKTYDINNNKIYTTLLLNMLNDSLNNIIEDNKNTIFINASEGGLNKNGAINCKLQDFIDNYCNKENQSDINNILNSTLLKSEKILTNEDLPKLKNFFNELIITLEKLLLNSDKAIKTSRELKNLYLFNESPDINEVHNLKNKLKKVDEIIYEECIKSNIISVICQIIYEDSTSYYIIVALDNSHKNINKGFVLSEKDLLFYQDLNTKLYDHIIYVQQAIKTLNNLNIEH